MVANSAAQESSFIYKFFSFVFTIGFFSAVIVFAYNKYQKIHRKKELILGSNVEYHKIN